VAVSSCGIGGYGGHMVIAWPKGEKVTAIDFNSAAPAAAREDMFSVDEHGGVKGEANLYGWLAAGVPGTLAGIQLAVDRYGTRPFRDLVRPAIRFAREGFEVGASFGRTARAEFQKDPGSARLLLDKGEPLAGTIFRNPDLAAMLETLAARKSVDSFYRGDIGERIAAAFQQHGGLVTAADMAAYHAREVQPLDDAEGWSGYEAVGEADPEGRFYDSFLDDTITRAIDALPAEYREAVILSDIHELRYAEIAEVLGIPEGTVKSRLFRGRRILQKKLVGYAVDMGYLKKAS